MQVFMSWSGPRSHRIAMDFNKWLPHVCQHLRPWISSEDNAKGADWAQSIRESLVNSRGVGLFFLTEAALKSQWFLFEAGCIAMLEHKRVCVIVVEDSVGERLKPPLSQFQRTRLEKADVFTLIKDLNALAGHPTAVDILDKAFDGVWDDFEQSIKASLAATANVDNEPSAPTAEALLNEMSEATRRIEARLTQIEVRSARTMAAPDPMDLMFGPFLPLGQDERDTLWRRIDSIATICQIGAAVNWQQLLRLERDMLRVLAYGASKNWSAKILSGLHQISEIRYGQSSAPTLQEPA